jgi:hypothetical protein
VPPGWPIQPGALAVPQVGAAEPLDQAQSGLADLGLVPADGPRAQPMRIPPRDPETSDVPGPSRIPVEEQDQQVAPPRRYP